MKIAIIDADLITRAKHRFPNLASMKLSGYYKEQGYDVELITNYNKDYLILFDKIYLSKVFTDTFIPEWVLELDNIEYGGTGFFYDKAPDLKYEIEHHMPDYHLYDKWVEEQLANGGKKVNLYYQYMVKKSDGGYIANKVRANNATIYIVNSNYRVECGIKNLSIGCFLKENKICRRFICQITV